MIQRRRGQRKVCGRGSKRRLKYDKELRKKGAGRHNKHWQLHSFIPLPPPYLLITASTETERGSTGKVMLVCKDAAFRFSPSGLVLWPGFSFWVWYWVVPCGKRTRIHWGDFLTAQIQVVIAPFFSRRWSLRLESWTLFVALVCVSVFTLLTGWNPVQRLVGFCSEISLFVFQGACFCFTFLGFWLELFRV